VADSVELSIVMPCLTEAETLARCIETARLGIQRAGARGEIIVADNGSTDGSQSIAEKLGVRVVPVIEKGCGSALRGGIQAASVEPVNGLPFLQRCPRKRNNA
jgi:glycosyltransferase involved in cell wall biosynthesis